MTGGMNFNAAITDIVFVNVLGANVRQLQERFGIQVDTPDNDALWYALGPEARRVISLTETGIQIAISRRRVTGYMGIAAVVSAVSQGIGDHYRKNCRERGIDPVTGQKERDW